MTTTPKRHPRYERSLRACLIAKCRPSALAVSPKFHAFLACLLGVQWTSPTLEFIITSDGFMIGGEGGFLGAASDLWRNIQGLEDGSIINSEEKGYLKKQIEKRSPYGWRPSCP